MQMPTPMKLRRLERGVLQIELAARTKITRSRLSEIECGHVEPRAEELERIAQALDVPVAALVPNGETVQGAGAA